MRHLSATKEHYSFIAARGQDITHQGQYKADISNTLSWTKSTLQGKKTREKNYIQQDMFCCTDKKWSLFKNKEKHAKN